MFKNIMLGVMSVLVVGWVIIYAFPAQADHRRDEWRVFDRLQGCTIWTKPIGGGHDMYAANCSIAID